MGSHSLLQRIFLTQGLKPVVLHCRWFLYCLIHQGSPTEKIILLFAGLLFIITSIWGDTKLFVYPPPCLKAIHINDAEKNPRTQGWDLFSMHLVYYPIQLPRFRIMGNRDFPGGPVVKTVLLLWGAQLQSLIRELRT